MARKKMTPEEKAAAKAVRVGQVEYTAPDDADDAATGTADDQSPLDVDAIREALADFEQMKAEAPARVVVEPVILSPKISSDELAYQRRQERRERRLAEKGY